MVRTLLARPHQTPEMKQLLSTQQSMTLKVICGVHTAKNGVTPKTSTHLISVSKFRKMISYGLLITLHDYFIYDKVKDQKIRLTKERDELYYIDTMDECAGNPRKQLRTFFTRSEVYLLHQRMGHPSLKTLNLLFLVMVSKI